MRKLLILSLLFMVSGCASFGRGVAEAIINDKKEDTRSAKFREARCPELTICSKTSRLSK